MTHIAQHIQHRLDFAKDLILQSGEMAHRMRAEHTDNFVEEKRKQDFVTMADKAIDDLWRTQVAETFKTDRMLTEEGEAFAKQTNTNTMGIWVLDPIDGTSNFVSGIPLWGISVAYIDQGEAVMGMLYYPMLNMLLWAVKGHGAYMNDTPICVSKETEFNRAKAIFSRSVRWKIDDYIDTIRRIEDVHMVYRFFGCASYSLACVAMGQAEMYYEYEVSIWDVLAGLIIVEEAGGKGYYNGTLSEFLYTPMHVLAHNDTGLQHILLRQ